MSGLGSSEAQEVFMLEPRIALKSPSDEPGRHPSHDGERLDVTSHDGTGRQNRTSPNRYTLEHSDTCSYPYILSNFYRFVDATHRCVECDSWFIEMMIPSEQIEPWPDDRVVAELHPDAIGADIGVWANVDVIADRNVLVASDDRCHRVIRTLGAKARESRSQQGPQHETMRTAHSVIGMHVTMISASRP